jgi:hypothetical protein
MKISLTTGLAMLTIAAVGVAGCGGDSTPAPATTAPAAATATTAAAKPDVVVPASGAAQSLSVNVGDTFTVWLNVSRKQAKAKKVPVVGWARNYDDATALTSQGPAQTVPWGKGGLQSQFQFTATTAGSADMGFRQTTSVQSGITPLAKTAVVHLTVN